MADTPSALSLPELVAAVRGGAAAIRLRVKLQPAGGIGAKVFPPTYLGGVYAMEKRLVDGKLTDCVLLDSVQSQANRLESALLEAYRRERLRFPLLAVQFPADLPNVADDNEITTLDAPHRIADAIFRDSTLGGVPFRPQVRARPPAAGQPPEAVSAEGQEFAQANVRYATPLFKLCPTALIFGVWDSTGAAGGLGNKFARAITSEIVGVGAVPGVRTASRIDPLGIEKGEIYEAADGCYVVRAEEARKDNGATVVFKRKKDDKGNPSEINHGNVPPDIVKSKETGEPIGGGVTFAFAEQTTVLSLSALRRLRFPGAPGRRSDPAADDAARTILAALALAAVAHQMDPPDYFLRSNCQLVLEETPTFERVVTTKDTKPFTLNAAEADALFAAAVGAKPDDLPWPEEKVTLHPRKPLVDLVRRSRELGGGT